jgi:nitrate reductase gamma subunit
MTTAIYLFIYAAFAAFAAGCVVRVYWYASAPVHLRWELYPVPHEEPERVKHGGSYFESVDHWTKPSHFNLLGEVRFMIPEMVFLKGLWEFNRKMWLRSFPFHFGLYLLMGTLGLLWTHALLAIFSPGNAAGIAAAVLRPLYTLTGIVGAALCVIGALGLLHRRLTDKALKDSTTPGDIFNLLFFVITIGMLLGSCWMRQPADPGAADIARGLMTFDTGIRVPGLLATGLVLSGLLIAYIPMTHMSHFIAKYFTYHSIRWDDKPIHRSRRLAQAMAQYLTYRPTWAAAHVTADGKRTWADIATTNPAQGAKK